MTPGGPFERDEITSAAFLALIGILGDGEAEKGMFDVIAPVIDETIAVEAVEAALLVESSVDVDELVDEYAAILAQRVKGINETTHLALRESLLEGIEAGESLEELIARVDKVFDNAIDSRAATIARTESLTAMNYTSMSVFQDSGVPFKGWVGILDDRIRDSHEGAHGQVVPIDQKFHVGESDMDFPGDPTAPAKEVCNCRCSVVPLFSEDGAEERYADIYRQFDIRMTLAETSLAHALRVEFDRQRTAILSQV